MPCLCKTVVFNLFFIILDQNRFSEKVASQEKDLVIKLLCKNMGFLSLTIFILLASEYLALPQNRGNSGKKPYDVPAGCRIEVKTVYDTVETRKKERTCTDKIK